MKELFIDVETTGTAPTTSTIREIGFIYRKNKKVIKTVEIKGPEPHCYTEFLKHLDGIVNKYDVTDKLYFLAYNAKFDNDFVREMFKRNNNNFFGSYFHNPYICVMQLAAFKFMRKNKFPENFKLSTVCKYFKIDIVENNLHGAKYDVKILKDLYNKLLKWK